MRMISCDPPTAGSRMIQRRDCRRMAVQSAIRYAAIVWLIAMAIAFAPWPELFM